MWQGRHGRGHRTGSSQLNSSNTQHILAINVPALVLAATRGREDQKWQVSKYKTIASVHGRVKIVLNIKNAF